MITEAAASTKAAIRVVRKKAAKTFFIYSLPPREVACLLGPSWYPDRKRDKYLEV